MEFCLGQLFPFGGEVSYYRFSTLFHYFAQVATLLFWRLSRKCAKDCPQCWYYLICWQSMFAVFWIFRRFPFFSSCSQLALDFLCSNRLETIAKARGSQWISAVFFTPRFERKGLDRPLIARTGPLPLERSRHCYWFLFRFFLQQLSKTHYLHLKLTLLLNYIIAFFPSFRLIIIGNLASYKLLLALKSVL